MEHLPDATIRLLGSTQVITSVFSVVKELFENSLDAGATSVEVKLDNYGLDKIEVRDNGRGIEAEDVPVFAKRHYTSKIKSHSDLESLATYGFRGEALASLCAVSDVMVTTKTSTQDVGFTYSLSENGDIKGTTPSHLGQGTTVCAKNLFKNLPVRKQYHNMTKKKKEDLKNVETLLMAYGMIQPAVRISLRHNKELVWQKVALQDSAAAMLNIFGKGVMGQMEWKTQELEDPQLKIELCVPKPGSDVSTMSRSAADRSFLSVNGRPVTVKDIDKLIRQYYSNCHACEMSRIHPVYFVRIKLPAKDVDVNLEPNKTTVMTTNMGVLRNRLEEMLLYIYGPLDQAPSWRYRDAVDEGLNLKSQEELPCSSEMCQPFRNPDGSKHSTEVSDVGFASSDKPFAHITREKHAENGVSDDARDNSDSCTNSVCTHTSQVESKKCFSSEEYNTECAPNQKDSAEKHLLQENLQRMNENQNIASNFDLGKEILDEVLCSFPSTSDVDNNHGKSGGSALRPEITVPVAETFLESKGCDNSGSAMNNIISVEPAQLRTPLCMQSLVLSTGPVVASEGGLGEVNGDTGSMHGNQCITKDSDDTADGDLEQKVVEAACDVPKLGPSAWSRGTSIVSTTGAPIQPVQLLAPTSSHFPGKRPLSPSHDQQVQKQMAPAEKRQATGRRLCPAQSTSYDMINNIAVKRPLSAREIFFKDKRPKVVQDNPSSDYDEVTEKLTQMWDNLSETEQTEFREKCWQDTQRYNKEVAAAKNVAGKVKTTTKVKTNPMCVRDMVTAASTQPSPRLSGNKKAVRYSRQCSLPFSIACLKTCTSQDTPLSQTHFPKVQVLGYLPSCKAWMCGRGEGLCVLNLHRLTETILYHRLLHQQKLVSHHCQPMRLTPSNVGRHWVVFQKLAESSLTLDPFAHITDCRISANGFHIKCWTDTDGNLCSELVGLCSSVPTYGLPDLLEVLELISSSDGNSLAQTRPLKVVNYLQGEAVRMARQQTEEKNLEDVQEVLEQASSFLPPGTSTCLHGRPFFHTLFHDLDAVAANSSQLDTSGPQQSKVSEDSNLQEGSVKLDVATVSNVPSDVSDKSIGVDDNVGVCLDDLMDFD